ncbi:MAG: NnrU family protein [Phyllobacteriaceae bacterium]|jgi:uncharacterized membrane protein|nr:NnrU family protein [Phyllobacteriaceae bacterium]
MWQIWLGVLLFAGPHLFSMLLPGMRDSLRASVGENPYKAIYAIANFVGVAFLVLGYSAAMSVGAEMLYQPSPGARHATMLLVLLAFVLVGASHGKGYIRSIVRHPMSLGVGLWAVGHLLSNGEKPVVVIFGMFLVLAALDIILCTLRGKKPTHTPSPRSDVIAVVVGLVLYAVFLFVYHPYILGVAVTG